MESAKLHIHKHTHIIGPCWITSKDNETLQIVDLVGTPPNHKGSHTLAPTSPLNLAKNLQKCIEKLEITKETLLESLQIAMLHTNQIASPKQTLLENLQIRNLHTPNCIIIPCWNHKASPPK
jgi:hypothetical protein